MTEFRLIVDQSSPAHTKVRVFAGPDPGTLLGALTFNKAEWEDFRAILISSSGFTDYTRDMIWLSWEND